jgi:hypothetical protein
MSKEFVTYKLDASRINVEIGDVLYPEIIIGDDYETDEEVKAGVYGIVESVRFNGWDHSMEVIILKNNDSSDQEEVLDSEPGSDD